MKYKYFAWHFLSNHHNTLGVLTFIRYTNCERKKEFKMAIPAYLWLKDDGGVDIKGAVDVQDREGSIEVLVFSHGLHLPTIS